MRRFIEPGPIVLVSSHWKGKNNIMTMGWHMVMDYSTIGCFIWDQNHSCEMIRKSRECVINVPTYDIIRKVIGIGNSTGAEIDKFDEFGLTAGKADKVRAPLIRECHANFECRLVDTSLIRKYSLFVFEVVKAGFIVGGRTGHGVISRRVKGGWGAPAFYNLNGGSFGLQIGAAKLELILLFMNTGAVESLMQDKFEMGGEGSVAAGPVGRSASATTDAQLKAQILSYSRSKGLFAGLELKGVVISPDNNDNEPVYGMKADAILAPTKQWKITEMPAGVRIFPRTLGRYSTRR